MYPSSSLPNEPRDAARKSFAGIVEEYGAQLALLSGREREVIEQAAEGFTDEQISQVLGLSVSTVNSYWVRVRGKLGSLSRTEIVAGFLRHQARVEHAALKLENRRLRDELQRATDDGEVLSATQASLRKESWIAGALLHLPEAILVTKPPANVVFVNRQARRLYAARARELEGLRMIDLTTSATPDDAKEPCRELFEEDGPASTVVGIAEPYFARRRDGTNFRAVLQAQRFENSGGPYAVVTVREYLSEVETIVQALRRPLETPVSAGTNPPAATAM